MRTLKKQVKFLQQQNLAHQQAAAKQQAKHHDKNKKPTPVKVGDLVRWRRPRLESDQMKKLASAWKGPYTVVQKVGKVNFKLQDKDGNKVPGVAHASDLLVVNGERPPVAGVHSMGIEKWIKERQQRHQARTGPKLKTD